MQFLMKKIIFLANMNDFLQNKLKPLQNIHMDKLKVYQKFYHLPEFTRNFLYMIQKCQIMSDTPKSHVCRPLSVSRADHTGSKQDVRGSLGG